MDITAQGRRATKTLEEKLDVEMAAHNSTKEEKSKLQEEAKKIKIVIAGHHELIERKKACYDEQIMHEREHTHQVKIRLNN